MKAVRVVVTGRVHGVSYRAWAEHEAMQRNLVGWVRNRRDGSVEAVFLGDAPAVDSMVSACGRGPPAAVVSDVTVGDYDGPPLARFTVLPTA